MPDVANMPETAQAPMRLRLLSQEMEKATNEFLAQIDRLEKLLPFVED